MFVIRLSRRRLALGLAALVLLAALIDSVTHIVARAVLADTDVAIRFVPVNSRVIALTFDDGPDAVFTPRILEILRMYKAKATFFVVGKQIEYFPGTLQQVAKAGHEIGVHTYSHPRLSSISQERLRRELDRSIQLITENCNVSPTCFRPPYGSMNASSVDVLREYGYSIILWDKELDSRDWERPGVQKIVDRVVNYARPGGIILMHDGGGYRSQTVAALPKILKQLGDQGYRFVTVSELMSLGGQSPNGGPH